MLKIILRFRKFLVSLLKEKVATQEIALTDHLFDQLFPFYLDEMPYGTKKARTGDPYQWITEKIKGDL